jgi:hypothetical protein
MNQPKMTQRFALEKHTGAYEAWPLQSRLIVDGVMQSVVLPGYDLLYQFETSYGFLLVTDFDCPFEQTTCFTLLSPALDTLASRSFGAWYISFWLDSLSWVDERKLLFSFIDEGEWQMRILSPGSYFTNWRMTVQPVQDPIGT